MCSRWISSPTIPSLSKVVSVTRDDAGGKDVCVGVKSNGGDGLVLPLAARTRLCVQAGKEPQLNTIELGQARSGPDQCVGVCGGEHLQARAHGGAWKPPDGEAWRSLPTQVKDASRRGDVVLDCFGGSG